MRTAGSVVKACRYIMCEFTAVDVQFGHDAFGLLRTSSCFLCFGSVLTVNRPSVVGCFGGFRRAVAEENVCLLAIESEAFSEKFIRPTLR